MQELLSHAGCTKTALKGILTSLQKRGMLHEGMHHTNSRAIKETQQLALRHYAEVTTPHGHVIQTMNLGPAMKTWSYVNPFAFLHYLSQEVSSFSDLLNEMLGPDLKT